MPPELTLTGHYEGFAVGFKRPGEIGFDAEPDVFVSWTEASEAYRAAKAAAINITERA